MMVRPSLCVESLLGNGGQATCPVDVVDISDVASIYG